MTESLLSENLLAFFIGRCWRLMTCSGPLFNVRLQVLHWILVVLEFLLSLHLNRVLRMMLFHSKFFEEQHKNTKRSEEGVTNKLSASISKHDESLIRAAKLAIFQQEKDWIHSLCETRRNLVIDLVSIGVMWDTNVMRGISTQVEKIHEETNEWMEKKNYGRLHFITKPSYSSLILVTSKGGKICFHVIININT